MAKKSNAGNSCGLCSKSPFCGFSNILIGIGLGAFLAYPMFGTHPVRWGAALIIVGLAGHLYPKFAK